MKNMTLKGKLYFGFGILVGLVVLIMAFSIFMLNQIEADQEETSERVETMNAASEVYSTHLVWAQDLSESIARGEEFTGQLDHTQCDFGIWYYSYMESEEFQQASSQFQQMFREMEGYHTSLHTDAEDIVNLQRRIRDDEELLARSLDIYDDIDENLMELGSLIQSVNEYLEAETDDIMAALEQRLSLFLWAMVSAFIITLIVGLTVPAMVSRSVTEPIKNVISFLQRLVYTSKEISAGNQDLAQRTEEQASSIEHISTNVEEMTSTIESNSANANQADRLCRDTMENVRQGSTVVNELQGAMESITQGSHEISEIISKVNDISFQTNLLALNAAVEAARAGEQGRGFAVVAAEVRNLAGRSAESAKEIERLIKDSINRVEKGNELMKETEDSLQNIVDNTQRVTDVVGEISASLGEQSNAASDINSSIEEINEVTQQNASLVEEVSSASANMTSEAEEVDEMVKRSKLVNENEMGSSYNMGSGMGAGMGYSMSSGTQSGYSSKSTGSQYSYYSNKGTAGSNRLPAGGQSNSGGSQGEDVLDFDDDDFEKF